MTMQNQEHSARERAQQLVEAELELANAFEKAAVACQDADMLDEHDTIRRMQGNNSQEALERIRSHIQLGGYERFNRLDLRNGDVMANLKAEPERLLQYAKEISQQAEELDFTPMDRRPR